MNTSSSAAVLDSAALPNDLAEARQGPVPVQPHSIDWAAGPGLLHRLFSAVNVFGRISDRLLLSRAKHPSLQGHPRMALRLSRMLPFYEYGEEEIFSIDGAPQEVAHRRRTGFDQLARFFAGQSPRTLALSGDLEESISDVAFVNAYRVPFQFRNYVKARMKVGCVVEASDGARLKDLDGTWTWDLGGAYGANLFGVEFYKRCIDRGVLRARDLGLVLGTYHPIIADNVRRLREISGLDEVSFHMSGTEAVMQAVRLARYHTGRPKIVRFAGAYHGWWDGVQAGPGNPLPARDVFSLREMDERTLKVLDSRTDIACVLVNPIQAMNPNGAPSSDGSLVASDRKAAYDKKAYAEWLGKLRAVCARRNIVLIFDEVFLGFRLARGGVQEYFGVKADLVTYGKSLGGGLPVGVVCGRHDLMRRFRDDRPADICFARGTFNSHPYVMATMNEFLRALDDSDTPTGYENIDAVWDRRARALNAQLEERKLPVRVANMTSVWTTLYTQPSQYNWMFQYYLRAAGLSMSWIGTGRFIFSHDMSEADLGEIMNRFISAAERMSEDGWWLSPPGATNKNIKRRVLRESLNARFASRR